MSKGLSRGRASVLDLHFIGGSVADHARYLVLERDSGSARLHVSVGNYTDTLLLDPLRSTGDLHHQLKRVATLLEQTDEEGGQSGAASAGLGPL